MKSLCTVIALLFSFTASAAMSNPDGFLHEGTSRYEFKKAYEGGRSFIRTQCQDIAVKVASNATSTVAHSTIEVKIRKSIECPGQNYLVVGLPSGDAWIVRVQDFYQYPTTP